MASTTRAAMSAGGYRGKRKENSCRLEMVSSISVPDRVRKRNDGESYNRRGSTSHTNGGGAGCWLDGGAEQGAESGEGGESKTENEIQIP